MWQGVSLSRAGTLTNLRSFTDYKKSELQNSNHSAVNSDGALWEHETLQLRVNPPIVIVDNETMEDVTLISISSANRPGTLVEVVTCLTELSLLVKSAKISSERGWFVDDFYVTEIGGEKVTDPFKLEKIHKILCVDRFNEGNVSERGGNETIVLEMSGKDKPGLLADITDLLTSNDYDVKSAAVWTQQNKVAFIMNIEDKNERFVSNRRLHHVCQELQGMLGGPLGYAIVSPSKCQGLVHHEHRLHLMLLREEAIMWQQQRKLNLTETDGMMMVMKASRNSSNAISSFNAANDKPFMHRSHKAGKPNVNIQPWPRLNYWLISIQCKDRKKLLFDIVCTLTDLDFDIYHGSVECGSDLAVLELYVRPRFQHLECIKDRIAEVQYFLEAAIVRRFQKGLKVHVRPFEEPTCLLRLLQELKSADLCVTRAKVCSDLNGRAMHTVYVMKSNGSHPDHSIVEAACRRGGGQLRMSDAQNNGDDDTEYTSASPKFAFSLKEKRNEYEWNGKPRSV